MNESSKTNIMIRIFYKCAVAAALLLLLSACSAGRGCGCALPDYAPSDLAMNE